jgi:hypothetical protein
MLEVSQNQEEPGSRHRPWHIQIAKSISRESVLVDGQDAASNKNGNR